MLIRRGPSVSGELRLLEDDLAPATGQSICIKYYHPFGQSLRRRHY